ncbi:PREDICTED: DNL-type zinc finger protein-like [Papilio xuthus]|uniref:DNL-type zinc finger protein-like n=1 Tax=Papilio xuthus TaxID=66420 RepID=A0AAJ7EDY0_PAPXU|nr:PREDICTED: DNL-type zinc finger protein-like [Papilio xuthus]
MTHRTVGNFLAKFHKPGLFKNILLRSGIGNSTLGRRHVYKQMTLCLSRTHLESIRTLATTPNALPDLSKPEQKKYEGKFQIMFTCKICNHRNSKFITKLAYYKGVVIIICDGCENKHLIADNLNWFTDMNGKKNIEDIMAEKGEVVQKIMSEDLEFILKATKEEQKETPALES